MLVSEAIEKRRAFQNLLPVEIDDDIINKLIDAAALSPSCFNNQPWRYCFVHSKDKLKELYNAYSKGNEWAQKASLAIAVYSQEELDCIIKDRKYYLFDTGISCGFLMLKATEMGLIAHPIAGFSPKKVKKILNIPNEMNVIAMILIGKHDDSKEELSRPERKSRESILKRI